MSNGDVRQSLPPGMNAEDMKEDGKRSGPLDIYGKDNAQSSVYKAFKAWNVQEHYLVNPTGMSINDGIPTITREGGPSYVLLFADKKWRYASFGGINGPPWFSCKWDGVEAPNGLAAWLMMKIEAKKGIRANLENEVKIATTELLALEAALAEAMREIPPKEILS